MRGGFFGAFGWRFAGVFGGEGGVRMGGFAAEFRGFWVVRGRGAAIQRTADTAGRSGRKKFLKIFKKGVEKPKNWGVEVPEGGLGAPYIGHAEQFLGLEARPLAALLGVRFVQVPQLQAPA